MKKQILILILSFGVTLTQAQNFKPQNPTLTPHISGPNCWNQALMSVSLLETPRFTSDEEFVYLINKSCTQTDSPSYGSLGRMNDQEGEVHAFIWISETEVYAKHSMGAFEQPSFMPTRYMLDTYLLHEECLPTSINPACFRQTTYYICGELAPEIKAQQIELRPLDLILNEIVYSLDTISKPRHTCESAFLEKRFAKLQTFINALEIFKSSGLIIEPGYLKTWVVSATEQLYEIKFNTYSETCLNTNLNYRRNYGLFETAKKSLSSIL